MIVKMKFLTITGPKEDIDRIVDTYFSRYEIHLENALMELSTVQELTPYLEINPYREDLTYIQKYADMLPPLQTESPKKLPLEKALEITHAVEKKVSEIEGEISRLHQELDGVMESLRIIQPFRNLNYGMSDILHFQFVGFRFGKIEKTLYEKFSKYVYDSVDTIFYRCHSDEEYVWGVYFAPKSLIHKVDAIYSSMHFERIFIPDSYEGTPQEAYQHLEAKARTLQEDIDRQKAALDAYLENRRQDILSTRYTLQSFSKGFDVRKAAACTKEKDYNFYILCGWMSKADADAFQKEIAADKDVICIVEEHGSGKDAPTKLKNPPILKPFEMFVRMYGLPAYNEMDPTWFVALTYSFIFGIMFGDVGQGLCLVLGGALLYKLKKLDLAAILSLAGIFSVVFGFLYGSFFGFEEVLPALWLKPMTAMTTLPFIGTLNTVFVAAIAFGMLLILITMLFHIRNAFRAKDVEGKWFDQNALAGFIFYLAVVVTVVLYMTGHSLPATAVLIVMFVVPLIIIMLKEPITRLVTKQSPAIEGGKGMFLVQSFFELFEIMLTYLSNTLSFVRMGAFAVSHAAMMEVVLSLAGAASGEQINWLVIILGNIFVCGMEGLIVCIQVLRLEFYEMFSRFYKGSGREFSPFLKKEISAKGTK